LEKAVNKDFKTELLELKWHDFALGNVSIRVDASNLHTWKLFQVGQVTPDNRISVTKTGEEPIPPVPFPAPRTRAEWQSFSDALYKKWGGNWANPAKPKQKKSKKH
jgi:urea transport system substrate-binding protein